ncbi:hypothetical protein GCM10028806_28100 [Spirosoma terrae]|uniref:ATP-binding protein n=1 Tax=Spirosoma terrae TaxID=1968276 RepID=A0A6L9LCD0_9BACT|nr:AAA family ATPase [Spirosoma terrae]NDU97227.1 ATP-binding protein [Spirosoma terrae]
MKITSIELKNIRGFKYLPQTEFSSTINLFIGPNNSGKSTILNSLLQIQDYRLNYTDIIFGQTSGHIILNLSDFFYKEEFDANPISYDRVTILISRPSYERHFQSSVISQSRQFTIQSNVEPTNIFYPYLSKRKVTTFKHDINAVNSNAVTGDLANIISKIDRLNDRSFEPGHTAYVCACKSILGFEVTTSFIPQGKEAVYRISNWENIPISSMGEGVVNMLGLIVDLCIAEKKIFVIEEIENDIHPKALKALLELLIQKSSTNQIFISTHSNIVMKYLGSVPDAKIFNIINSLSDPERPSLFISQLTEVANTPQARREVLEDLGYDLFDFGLWKGWLFLEESSAERIIRDWLIPWFVDPLQTTIKTFSASGVTNIEPKLNDFDKLFIFLHLESMYKNRVWVLIDGGEHEDKIIEGLRSKYVKSGWNTTNFQQLSQHDFEKYYPDRFQEEVDATLSIIDDQKKRKAKEKLLYKVLDWIKNNKDEAQAEFAESAKEVIEILQTINSQLNS